jgi:chromosome partitioning protein
MPIKGTVVTVANQKGGVGKTSAAVNLGAILAEQGERVLLVDLDPQGCATEHLGLEDSGEALYAAIHQAAELEDGVSLPVRSTSVPGLDIVPSGDYLTRAENTLAVTPGYETIFLECLLNTDGSWTWIFVDCRPSLGALTVNGLVASGGNAHGSGTENWRGGVLVTLQSHPQSLRGLGNLRRTIASIQRRVNPRVTILGALPSMVDTRTVLYRDVNAKLNDAFGETRVGPPIRSNITIAEAPAHGLPVSLYDSSCIGTQDYRAAAQWLRKLVKHG